MKRATLLIAFAIAGTVYAGDSGWWAGVGFGPLELRDVPKYYSHFEKDNIWELSVAKDLKSWMDVELKELQYSPQDVALYGGTNRFKMDSLMLSLRVHPFDWVVRPFLAGGLNGTRSERSLYITVPGATWQTETTTALGWQASCGVEARISKAFMLYAEYRYLQSPGPEMYGTYSDDDIEADIITAGLKYGF